MDIGDAVRILKAGGRVRRAGWNGPGAWLFMERGATFDAGRMAEMKGQMPRSLFAHLPPGERQFGAHVWMFTAQGVAQPGWLCSQADLVAEDWEEVPGLVDVTTTEHSAW